MTGWVFTIDLIGMEKCVNSWKDFCSSGAHTWSQEFYWASPGAGKEIANYEEAQSFECLKTVRTFE